MPSCEHEGESGRFCSQCGQVLKPSPLADLLKHCRQAEHGQHLAVKRWKEREGVPQWSKGGYPERAAAGASEAARRWKERGDALAALLAERETREDN